MKLTKEIQKRITTFMKANGFAYAKNNIFCSIVNDIAFCISFEKPSYCVYVTLFIMPLYIPCEFVYYTYGDRMSNIPEIMLPDLEQNSSADEIDAWCKIFCQQLEKYIFPLYRTIDTPIKLLQHFERKNLETAISFQCSDVFYQRLRMYTWLYLGDILQTEAAIRDSVHIIYEETSFAELRQHRLNKTYEVDSLIKQGEQAMRDFVRTTIAYEKRVLGIKEETQAQ